jgi:hypothetical protein
VGSIVASVGSIVASVGAIVGAETHSDPRRV